MGGQRSGYAPVCVPESEFEDDDELLSWWGCAALSPLTFTLSPCSIHRYGASANIYEKDLDVPMKDPIPTSSNRPVLCG